jgi:hypothetical protein
MIGEQRARMTCAIRLHAEAGLSLEDYTIYVDGNVARGQGRVLAGRTFRSSPASIG